MRTILIIVCAIAVSIAASATSAQSEQPAIAVSGFDPVTLCSGDEIRGDESITSTYLGMAYHFESTANKHRFDADPERWGAQQNAECAVMPGVPADPALFAVHNERIYLFGSSHCREAFVENPEVYLTERMRVAVLIFEGMELLDFAGPGEVFSAAGRHAFDVYTVAATTEPITSQGFVEITPEFTVDNAPMPKILVIPGGDTGSIINHPASMEFVRRAHEEGDHILSVCNGAGVLARLGFLDGLTVTSHHSAIPGLRSYGTFEVLDDARYVDNGKIITTAGVSAGIDGSLHLVENILGTNIALQTARYIEYDWQFAGEVSIGRVPADD